MAQLFRIVKADFDEEGVFVYLEEVRNQTDADTDRMEAVISNGRAVVRQIGDRSEAEKLAELADGTGELARIFNAIVSKVTAELQKQGDITPGQIHRAIYQSLIVLQKTSGLRDHSEAISKARTDLRELVIEGKYEIPSLNPGGPLTKEEAEDMGDGTWPGSTPLD